MQFWKMSGTGNDFILLDNRDGRFSPRRLSALARHLCRRGLSLGADGLMAAEPPENGGDFRMRFFNADGSQGEMCGNGARCICRWGYETGACGPVQRIETAAGAVEGRRIDRRNYRIRLNTPTVTELERPVSLRTWDGAVSYMELGDPGLPHAAVHFPGLAEAAEEPLRAMAREMRHHEAFPRGCNVNFYCPLPEGAVLVRTYERGVEDFTLSCGTGSGCVAAVLTLRGVVDGAGVRVRTPGGALTVDVSAAGGAVTELFLTGPANILCQGRITDDDLPL